jgi:hypothetical protein
MPDDETQANQSNNTQPEPPPSSAPMPDREIVVPGSDYLTEGFDPASIRKK